MKKLFLSIVTFTIVLGCTFADVENIGGIISTSCNPSSVTHGTVDLISCAIRCNTGYELSVEAVSAATMAGQYITGQSNPDMWCIQTAGSMDMEGTETGAGSNTLISGMRQLPKLINSLDIVNNFSTTIYTTEVREAYDFAFSKGITTMATIDTANMTGYLIRSHAAKMIVRYAMDILNKTLDTSKICQFSDIGAQSQELQTYALQVCQLGLMGVATDKFMPNDVVTRAQLGTILSRMLYATSNSGNPYYEIHLNVLKEKGIIININPELIETRSYVMIMLMRAAE